MILMIDNYDSFTYNLVQYGWELGADMKVYRNDMITISEIEKLNPRGIIISPGPGRPENSGITVEVIEKLGGKTPILGVCLGHQAIGYAFGGKIIKSTEIYHGKVSKINHNKNDIFSRIETPFTATRYHSLVISPENFPKNELDITAWTENNIIMAVKHKKFPIWGVQFHPESILTEYGHKLIENFLNQCS